MPLAATLAALPPLLSCRVDDQPPGEGWMPADAACRDEALLEELLAGVASAYRTERRDIMGTRVVEIWAWMVAAPAAAALLAARRVPDVRAGNLLVAPAAYGVALRGGAFCALPDDPEAGQPGVRVVPDEAALAAELRTALAEDHLGPLVETINAMTRRPARALWRSAADRITAAFLWAGEELGRLPDAERLAAACLRDAPGPLSGRVRREACGEDGELLHIRDGCCLYYRVPDGVACSNCPLIDDATRRERVAAERAAVAGAG